MWIGTWIPRTTAHGSKMCGELKLSGLMIRCWISLEIQPFNPIWGWTVSVGRNRLKPNKRDDNVFKSTETQIINCCAWCYETFVPFPMGIQFHPHQCWHTFNSCHHLELYEAFLFISTLQNHSRMLCACSRWRKQQNCQTTVKAKWSAVHEEKVSNYQLEDCKTA